jgi:two-component system, OmpR family, sensor histidine kinase KdpD
VSRKHQETGQKPGASSYFCAWLCLSYNKKRSELPMTEKDQPEVLPAQGQKKEERQARGKLKIFLGYVAGVGKTYAMLETAQQRRAEGVDLVVAYIETHGRAEIEALLTGLELILRKKIDYRGITLTEMDLDGVLARRPRLALVDELAHTNAPGSRHTKRYQDVEELLAAGIDVYTTLNIQHLESLNDVVAQITEIIVQETVPDRILDEAYEIELIDLPIDELLQRLQEGKVYAPEQADRAVRKFFRPGNLTALRELVLRRAADRVDEQMRAYMQRHAITGPWPAGERLLVCISPSPLSERLVRAGRRMAARLNAEWFVAYVETPGHTRLSAAARDRIVRTLQLAESLGAKTVTLTGRFVAEPLATFAHARNITRIVVGKPLRSRWLELLRGSIVDQVIRYSGDIDIYIISSSPEGATTSLPDWVFKQPNLWPQYLQSAALVVLVTLIGFPLSLFIEATNLVMLYLLAVVIAAVRLGRRPAILASILSVLAFDFIFVHPFYTFAVSDAEYLLTFAALLIVGVVISTLAAQAREQAGTAQQRATQTAALYELSQDLAGVTELKGIAEILEKHISQLFGGEIALFLPGDDQLDLRHVSENFSLDENERAVAMWVFQHGQPAGQGSNTLAGANATYLPLKTARNVMGVLGINLAQAINQMAPEQRRLREAFASQAAQAIERVQLAGEAAQAQLLRETEKLQTILLNSISHDLRTPLTSITGALSSLRDDTTFLNEAGRTILINTAWEQAKRLNTLVGNLLDMSRLEAKAMKVKLEPGDIQDVIGVALSQLAERLEGRPLNLEIPDNLPLVPLDFVLLVQVLVNLLDNALKYASLEAPLTLRASLNASELIIEVMDRGEGIPEKELARIFEKFYRVRRSNDAGGTGLGLSISKGIVEAHRGRIWATARPGGGSIFTLALPLAGERQAEVVEG